MTTRTTPRAFSLIEAMAAMAIAAVIIAGATGAVMNINRIMADGSRKTAAWDETKRLEEFLIARAQAAGGGALRPHTAIFVENANGALAPGVGCRVIAGLPDCTSATQGADRLTVFRQDPLYAECPVLSQVGASVNMVVGDGPGPGACCLDDGPTYEGVQALLVGPNGTVSIALNTRNSGGGTTNCSINAPPGQGSGLIGTDIATAGFPATLVVAVTETFFVDRPAHQLKVWNDANADLIVDAGETKVLHDRVYDMQLSPGYDGRPEDGKVVDADNAADEYLFNSTADAAMPASVTLTQLRMMQIAVVVGTPSTISGGNSVRMLNRPAASAVSVPGVYLTATASKAFMRNLALFTQ